MAYSNLFNQGSHFNTILQDPEAHKNFISTIVAQRHKNAVAENMNRLKAVIRLETQTLANMMHERERFLCQMIDQYESILSQNCCACSCHPTFTENDSPPQKQRLEYQSPFNDMKKLILDYGQLRLVDISDQIPEDLTSTEQPSQKEKNLNQRVKNLPPQNTKKEKDIPESEYSFELLDSTEIEDDIEPTLEDFSEQLQNMVLGNPPLDLRLTGLRPISKTQRPSQDYFNKIMEYLSFVEPSKKSNAEEVKRFLESKNNPYKTPSELIQEHLAYWFPEHETKYVFEFEMEDIPGKIGRKFPNAQKAATLPGSSIFSESITNDSSNPQAAGHSLKADLCEENTASSLSKMVSDSVKEIFNISERVKKDFEANVTSTADLPVQPPSDKVKDSLMNYLAESETEKWLR